MTSLERERLMRAARAGDERAYAQLVAPYRAELHRRCASIVGCRDDAEDATQEALLRAWRALPRFDAPGALRPWLHRIAGNCALDVVRRRRLTTVADIPEQASTATADGRTERLEEVERALLAAHARLPARQRAVLILREGLDFSAAEVAVRLETSTASVNSALQRARANVARRPRAEPDSPINRRAVRRYAEAWTRDDVDGLVEMLAADAA